jgi:hypothetical protein
MPDSVPSDNKASGGILKYLSVNRILLKAKYSFYSALIFFVFSNPETHKILQHIFGNKITILDCGLNIYGLIITSILFFTTMLGLMLIPDL